MMKRLTAIVGYTCFSTAIHAADSGPADKPEFQVGDSYEYTDKLATVNCPKWTVASQDNAQLRLDCGDYMAYLSVEHDYNLVRITNQQGQVRAEFKPYNPALSFPLQLGKTWTGSYSGYTRDNGNRWNSKVDCEVEAFEEITIAAGTLKAFRIDCVDNWSAGSYRGTGHVTRWYSPEARTLIKVLHREDSRWNEELSAYTVQ